jgi:hypothetical protein
MKVSEAPDLAAVLCDLFQFSLTTILYNTVLVCDLVLVGLVSTYIASTHTGTLHIVRAVTELRLFHVAAIVLMGQWSY